MTAPKAPLTAREVAERLDTDPKTFRVFLRANAIPKSDETGRYEFRAGDVAKLKKQFTAWTEHRAEARAAAKAAKEAATPTPEDDDHFGDEPFDEQDNDDDA